MKIQDLVGKFIEMLALNDMKCLAWWAKCEVVSVSSGTMKVKYFRSMTDTGKPALFFDDVKVDTIMKMRVLE